jgi:proteasome lid subunit RPN8/RPN11
LPAALGDEIRRHARRELPEECCGVLLGRQEEGLKTVVAVRPAANLASSRREDRFEIAPADLLTAIREGRARGLDLLGFYHSHPHGDPTPSRADLEQGWTGTTTLILSLGSERRGRIRSFRLLREGRSEEEVLEELS